MNINAVAKAGKNEGRGRKERGVRSTFRGRRGKRNLGSHLLKNNRQRLGTKTTASGKKATLKNRKTNDQRSRGQLLMLSHRQDQKGGKKEEPDLGAPLPFQTQNWEN